MELTNLKFAKILWILITGLIRKVFVDKVLTIANYSMPFQNDLRVATKVPKTSKNLENNLDSVFSVFLCYEWQLSL